MGRSTQRTNAVAAAVALTLALAIPSFAQTAPRAASDLSKRTVLVSIPDRKLAVISGGIDGGEVLATFPIAVGAAESPSPTGAFQIVSRVANPTYYHPGKVIPAGKDNPLGTRWVGLSQQGYGIHGTNAPKSVGHAASHGCFRLRNRDMERLFTMLRVGDAVVIRGERDDRIAQVFGSGADDAIMADAQTASATVGQ